MPSRRALPTLDRMHALMALLGDPHESIPSVHVTGTNGKGSTSAMVTALMMAQGLSVGTYTSPNLHRVSERLAHNGEPIDDEAFLGVLSELASLEPMLPERPTRFELLTAAACRGSPTTRSTPWWSRWDWAARGTPPTCCTATWPC